LASGELVIAIVSRSHVASPREAVTALNMNMVEATMTFA
jgi:hypothetical protein